jgi:hypothetical protein
MKINRWMAAAFMVLALPIAALAQGDAGRIAGTVSDPTGAFVEGARVTVTNQRTGETRTVRRARRGTSSSRR